MAVHAIGDCKNCEATKVEISRNGYCKVCEVFFKKTRDTGECGSKPADTAKHVFRCPGQTYEISQADCDRRQADPRFAKKCSKCTMRQGGKNDPR